MFLATCGEHYVLRWLAQANIATAACLRIVRTGGVFLGAQCTSPWSIVQTSAGAQARRARRVTRRLPNNRLCMSLWRTNRNVGSGSSCETLERQRLRHFARCEEVRFGIHEAATRGATSHSWST